MVLAEGGGGGGGLGLLVVVIFFVVAAGLYVAMSRSMKRMRANVDRGVFPSGEDDETTSPRHPG